MERKRDRNEIGIERQRGRYTYRLNGKQNEERVKDRQTFRYIGGQTLGGPAWVGEGGETLPCAYVR